MIPIVATRLLHAPIRHAVVNLAFVDLVISIAAQQASLRTMLAGVTVMPMPSVVEMLYTKDRHAHSMSAAVPSDSVVLHLNFATKAKAAKVDVTSPHQMPLAVMSSSASLDITKLGRRTSNAWA